MRKMQCPWTPTEIMLVGWRGKYSSNFSENYKWWKQIFFAISDAFCAFNYLTSSCNTFTSFFAYFEYAIPLGKNTDRLKPVCYFFYCSLKNGACQNLHKSIGVWHISRRFECFLTTAILPPLPYYPPPLYTFDWKNTFKSTTALLETLKPKACPNSRRSPLVQLRFPNKIFVFKMGIIWSGLSQLNICRPLLRLAHDVISSIDFGIS